MTLTVLNVLTSHPHFLLVHKCLILLLTSTALFRVITSGLRLGSMSVTYLMTLVLRKRLSFSHP